VIVFKKVKKRQHNYIIQCTVIQPYENNFRIGPEQTF